ncbi:MAG: hypothetical protein P8X57_13915, partial [Cyclobacteriaceae bacterium]
MDVFYWCIILVLMNETVMHGFRQVGSNINSWLTGYVRVSADTPDVILQKKIWWLFNIAGLPILVLAALLIG